MESLDGWIDVFRTGRHTDMAGNTREWTKADIDSIVGHYAAQDPSPCVIGHPEVEDPAYGFVDKVRRSGEFLQVKLRDMMPAFAQAILDKRYPNRSVSLRRHPEGGFMLKHLGWLGAFKPAVEGLRAATFAGDGPEQVFEFANEARWSGLARMLRGLREWLIETSSVERADRIIPQYQIDDVAAAGGDTASMAAQQANRDDTNEDPSMTGTNETTIQEQQQALDAQAQDLEARSARLAAREARYAAEELVKPLVREGRVLPADEAGMTAFVASLPAGDDAATIKFAAAEGDAEKEQTPLAFFSEWLKGQPKRVNYAEDAPSDGYTPTGDSTDSVFGQAAKIATRITTLTSANPGMTELEALQQIRQEDANA